MEILTRNSLIFAVVVVFVVWYIFLKKIKLNKFQILKRVNKTSSAITVEDEDVELEQKVVQEPLIPDVLALEKFKTNADYLHPVVDQGTCGSCTAFSTIQVISTNYARENGTKAEYLSPQLLLSCRSLDPEIGTCLGYFCHFWLQALTNGGRNVKKFPEDFAYVPLSEDLPYIAQECDYDPDFPTMWKEARFDKDGEYHAGKYVGGKCLNIEEPARFCKVGKTPLDLTNKRGYTVDSMIVVSTKGDKERSNIDKIKQAIWDYGAVTGDFPIYLNFMDTAFEAPYKYTPDPETEFLGMHAVILVGWEPGYWWIQNSWGTRCHDYGHFLLSWGSLKAPCGAVQCTNNWTYEVKVCAARVRKIV